MSYHVPQRVEPHTVSDLTFPAFKSRRAFVAVFKPPKDSKQLTIKQKYLQADFYIGKVNVTIAWRSAMVILLRFNPTSAIITIQPSFCSLYSTAEQLQHDNPLSEHFYKYIPNPVN